MISKLFQKSLVLRFNSVILSLFILGLLLMAISIGIYDRNRVVAELNGKLGSLVNLTKLNLSRGIWEVTSDSISEVSKALFQDQDVSAIQVLDEDKVLLFEIKNQELESLSFEEIKALDQYLYFQGDVTRFERKIGEVHIVASTHKVQEAIENILIIISFFTLFLIFSLGFVILLFTN